MLIYTAQRIMTALIVAWIAVSLAFVALRWAPGDALDATMARTGASPADIEAQRDALGFNDPLMEQYAEYLGAVLRGDLGESLISYQRVDEMIALNIGATASLAGYALLVAIVLGILVGVLAGLARWAVVRYTAEVISSIALSTPVYWTSTLAIYLFTIVLDVLPGVGGQGARYLILPVGVLGFHVSGSIARVTASSVRESAQQDYVRTARAKGLRDRGVLYHILRVGLLPVVAVVALQLGFLLSGTVITETIFVRRGLGRLLIDAVDNRDYPVIQGLVVLSALVYSLINALADVLYGLLDPRVTIER